jgi:2,5-furandicarboxylate decarboxylase 1
MSTPPGPPGASLRGWLDHLAGTGRLALARAGLALRHEVAAVAARLDGTSAVLAPRPDGHPVPIVSGLLGRRSWMAEALGCSAEDLLPRVRAATTTSGEVVETRAAPCQEVVHTGEAVDLTALLPIPTHNEHDHGPYVTAGLLITRHPDSGEQNVAIHRLQVSGRNRFGVLLLPRHTLAFADAAEARGADLDVAVVIGVDPLTLLASQAIVPLGRDELGIAAALHGAPLPVVRCRGNDVRVPAEAEIVLEGRLRAGVREPEGPFGEFPQYYGPRADRHVLEVDTVTHRRDPIFHTIVGGGGEHLLLGGIPREASFLAQLQALFPGVRDLHLSRGGTCRYHLAVQLEKTAEGQARNVVLGALALHYDVKHVTVVDTDVDVHDPAEVEWAVATRFQADRDLVVVPGAQGSKLDPSTDDGVGAKMGLDATVPLAADPMTFTRIGVPGAREVDLDATVSAAPPTWRDAIAR